MRIGILLGMLWAALAAGAVSHWYETPVAMPAGLTVIDVVDAEPERLLAHARCAVDPGRGGAWGLAWNVRDSLNMQRAVLTFAREDIHDNLRLAPAILTVESVAEGRVEVVERVELTSRIDREGGYNSIKISYADGVALLCVGADAEAASIVVDIAGSGSSAAVALWAAQPVSCQRLQAESVKQATPACSRCTDYDSLLARISASRDPMEGFWRYLDRNVDTAKAELGGVYTIATVREGDGYEIVYIDGAEIEPSQWTRMSLKGRLTPTPFVGNYDMDWYTSSHLLLDSETNAQVSDDHTILTCRFPLLNSSLRFARLTLPAAP